MDNEMIERVAMHICEQLFGPYDPFEAKEAPSSPSGQSRLAAIEAVKAMREPTETVIIALNCVHRRDAFIIWETTIDAIIGE